MYYKRIRAKAGYDQTGQRQNAVAIGYDAEKDNAPRVLAAGQGVIAEKIIELARQNGIVIKEDPLLVAALATLEVDTLIPPELYAVVAEVLAYVYRVRERQFNTPVPPSSDF